MLNVAHFSRGQLYPSLSFARSPVFAFGQAKSSFEKLVAKVAFDFLING